MPRQKRRAKGEGTTFIRTETTADGKVITWYVGRLTIARGRRQEIWRRSQHELVAAMSAKREEVRKGLAVAPTRTSVGDVVDAWIADRKRAIRGSTIARYQALIEKWIREYIGSSRAQRFDHHALERYYRDLERDGASPSTLRKVHRILSPAFHAAVRREIVARNPCDLVDTPAYAPAERKVYNEKQIRAFLKALDGDELEGLYVLALFTTAREGELFALRRSDVDLAKRVMYVRRSMTDDGNKTVAGKPKTRAARRGILLPSIARDALKAHFKRAMGKKHRPKTELVFHDELGGALRRQNLLRRSLYPLQQKAKLPRITFHDLRHSGATLLKSNGIDSTVVQKRLGHTRVSTTDDIYIHVPAEIQQSAVTLLDHLFPKSAKSTSGGKGGGKAAAAGR